MKIAPVQKHQNSNLSVDKAKNKNITFTSSYIQEFNNKFSSIKSILKKETDDFILNGNNAVKIGEGISGETYRFTHPRLSNIVIKRNKPGYKDNYSKEYKNLLSVPADIIGGQEAVARVRSDRNFYLISTLVSGKCVSRNNPYTKAHLRNLFDKMFELDKLGIYHGDLNGKNILLSSNGTVNFIDYQWLEQVKKVNFFDYNKSEKILLPISEFPQNAQMFEMASMPWYIDSLTSTAEKEQFLKLYLHTKANYHEKRYDYIKKITRNWPYHSELSQIRQSLFFEKAKSEIFKNPDKSVLKLEMKKFQFLSDYRDAYSHIDPNLPDRNILATPSSYLCSISSLQDFRHEVHKELKSSVNRTKINYLKSLEDYGNYWYGNLTAYTPDTFDYIMRMAKKKKDKNEKQHNFYINNRNPRIFSPNRDLLESLGTPYKPLYQRGLDAPDLIGYRLINLYKAPIQVLQTTLDDEKSVHQIEKLKGLFKKHHKSALNQNFLDTLNVSEVGVLKIREFRSYVKHNFSSYLANSTLSSLFENAVTITEDLFQTIFRGLQSSSSKNIIVKGYDSMRHFIYKI